ncbi:MAG: hypothetical protein ABR549_19060 [Mycobacteriales bacterium]
MFKVLIELQPTRYWLVCQGCQRRWPLVPDHRLLPQTRRIFAEQADCPPADDGQPADQRTLSAAD